MSIGKNSLARAAAATATRSVGAEVKAPAQYSLVAVETILPLKGKTFPAAEEALTESVKRYGVLEPLLLARTAPDELRVVSGERRLCAAKAAGLTAVPAVVVEMTATEAAAAKAELGRFVAAPAQPAGTVEATTVGQAMPAWLL